jgi:hypothetical protein
MISKLLTQIRQKRQRAKRAGLEIISTEKLALLALASPHWREIGRGKDKYNFCRRDHSIGYTAENTFIGPFADNIRERHERCGPPRGESLAALTPAEREQRKAGQKRTSHIKNRAKNNLARRKREAAAAGKAATASNSTPMNINLGEEHDVEQNKI